MLIAVGAVLLTLLVFGPTLWVRFVLWRHSRERAEIPGTGGELAQHLVEKFELQGVSVLEGGENQDHYNPETQTICLSPRVYRGKSITSIAVATHEVGHAIQFVRQEPVSRLRQRYMKKAFHIRRVGSVLIAAIPLIALIVKSPHLVFVGLVVGVITMLASVLMYVAILPEEYDASFNKALPILESGYVPETYIPSVKQVLQAAALTYVAAALLDVVRLWRWIRFLR